MYKRLVGSAALVLAAVAQPATAQRPLNVEIGAFGAFTFHDKDLNIENAPSIGGRLGLFLLKNLAAEGDIHIGKADWARHGTTTSLTLRPWAVRMVYGIPLSDNTRFLLGAGFQQNVYIGRTEVIVPPTVSRNEYEDSFTALVGIKQCLGDKWNFRVDGVGVHSPSPNFTGDGTLNGKATNFNIRAGLGTMLRGDCPGAPFLWTLGLTPPSSRHRVGETEQLQATALDGKGSPIALTKIKNYRCSSDNPNVATVDQNARLSAVAPGTATITCSGTVSGVLQSASHTTTVRRTEWRVAVTGGGTHQVGQGGSASATATDEDNRAVTGTVAWTSSNPSVVTVDANGNYRCVGAGNATLTVTFTRADETRSSTVEVNCTTPPPPPPPPTPPPTASMIANLSHVHFGFAQSSLNKVGRDTLDWVIGQMKSAAAANWMISIEGHTDPYGSQAYNDRLSNARARTVYTYLTRLRAGVEAARISGQSGFGEACLVLADDHDNPQKSKDEHVENRRVEIWVLNGTAVPAGCRPMSDYQRR